MINAVKNEHRSFNEKGIKLWTNAIIPLDKQPTEEHVVELMVVEELPAVNGYNGQYSIIPGEHLEPKTVGLLILLN
jgi:hypothetical protein